MGRIVAANNLKYLFSFILLWISLGLAAQSNHLNKRITIAYTNLTVEQVLNQISDQGDFNFSYKSNIIDTQRRISGHYENKTVYRILREIFDNEYEFKAVGTHIIILPNHTNENLSDLKGKQNIVTGYIRDSQTGNIISDATVYEIKGQLACISNDAGFYQLSLPATESLHSLNVSKVGYIDTVIFVLPTNKQQVDVVLKAREGNLEKLENKQLAADIKEMHSYKLVDLVVSKESKTISDNLTLYQMVPAQVSIWPFLGTNGNISGSVDNMLSLNIFAGYANGVNGFELGGLLNIDRNHMDGVQIGGLGNFVGGNSVGLQMAGISNVNIGKIQGFQGAGIANVLLDSLIGVQAAGIQNVLKGEMRGAQISGINNVSLMNVDGVQITGILNVAFKDVNTAQIAGIANVANNNFGVQIAGILNGATGDVDRIQIASILNVGRNIGGMQVSGIANGAWENVHSAQLAGIINISNNTDGYQLAGVVNGAWGDVEKAQIAGIANYARSVNGFQLAGISNVVFEENNRGQMAGIINIAGQVNGFQLAAIANGSVREVNGAQVSVYANITQKLNGIQLGMVNICDTVEWGTPIGLCSFVLKGYNKIDFQTDETFWFSIAYKPGIQRLYNVFKMGYGKDSLFYAAWGLGTSFPIKNRWKFSTDATYSWLYNCADDFSNKGNIFRLNPTFDYAFTPAAALYFGPSYNVSVIKEQSTGFWSDYSFYPFYDKIYNNKRVQMWIGFTLGFRLGIRECFN